MLPRRNIQEDGRTLLGDYAALLQDSVLRQRASVAEQDARVQAQLVAKLRSDFLANMSHELRTPLNTVMGFSKMMADHAIRPLKDKDITDYSRIIHDAGSQLLSVINDILDMSKMEAGRYILDHTDADIGDILRTCARRHVGQADAAGLHLREDIADDLAQVRGEPAKLQRILTNVLSNAIKFTPRGGAVTLRARDTANAVVVAIEDTGIGMTAEDIAVALTPFGQVDGSRSRWREGTGLGLPIANSLVQLHGGTLGIASAPGTGTKITITLPHAERSKPSDVPTSPPAP